jgi:hypothetical protein
VQAKPSGVRPLAEHDEAFDYQREHPPRTSEVLLAAHR